MSSVSNPPKNPWSNVNSVQKLFGSQETIATRVNVVVQANIAPSQTESTRLNTSPAETELKFEEVTRGSRRGKQSQNTTINKTNIVANETIYLNNKEIDETRYSQDSIKQSLTSGKSLDAVMQNMLKNGYDHKYPIRVVDMPDGRRTSLDNRRLYCASAVAKTPITENRGSRLTTQKIRDFVISAKIFDHTTRVPKKEIQNARNQYRTARKEYCETRGISIKGDIQLPHLQSIHPDLRPNTYGELVILRMNSGETASDALGYSCDPDVRN